MRTSFLKQMFAALALISAMAVPAAAQTTLGANVTFLNVEEETGTGLAVDLAGAVAPAIDIVGEVGFNNYDNDSLTSFLGGVRFKPAVDANVIPFVQALVGIERWNSDFLDETSNGFAFQIGGGIEIPVGERLRVRAQYDFRRTSHDFGDGFEDDLNGNRFGVGVVIPLGQ